MMVKLSVDLNEPKDSSKTDKAAQNEMSKYVKDYKIILVYAEHGSSNEDTSMFDSSHDVNRNVKKKWEKVSSKASSIDEVIKKLSKEQPTSFVARPIVVESDVDPFDGLDEILSTSSIVDDFSFGKFKEVEVKADTESEEEKNDTKGNDTSGQQFASKEIVKGKVKEHSVKTRRQLILVKNNNESVRVRCEGTIPALVLYVAIDTNMGKNVFSQTKGGPAIRENSNSGKQNILGKDKTVEGKGKKVIRPKKVDKYKMYSFNPILNLNYPQGLIQVIASVFPSVKHRYCVRHIHENMKSQFKEGVYKEMLWNATKATSEGKAKCDLLINNICEVFNREFVDVRDQPIITCLEYIREYLMKRIVVVQKVIAKIVGPLTPYVTKMFHVVESKTVIIPPLYKLPIGRPPKKRKKSNDEIASQSASSGKLSKNGKSVSCGKCGNIGHNMKGCRGQGGGSSQVGARKVSGQAAGSRKVVKLLVQEMYLVKLLV
nr:hypothetical protein [Tanacetum cinerariifolium]